ncbi:MAG: SDR family oxidoreductase [Acidobacteriota bacterium]|nr:SDR family oxidoreductase [Acidobacteriota bacterium]
MLLSGNVALITGGSRGIGKAIARVFAREGCAAVICGRKQESLEAAAREIGPNVIPIACHVGKPEDLQRLVAATAERFGKIDILVNNAGTNVAQGPCLAIDDGQFDKMIEVNLKSAFRLVRLVAPGMCERGSGAIINIASIAGIRPQFEGLLYSMTKAALIMMTQSYALELGPKGVRVNAIAPGLIRTVLSEYYWKDEDRRAQFLDRQPVKHLGEPSEIAEIALMLVSDRASYMTGQTVVVDGGSTLR